MASAQHIIARFDHAEYRWCRSLNRAAAVPPARRLFQVASRLGDGVAWYLLMAALPLACGPGALRAVLAMALTGAAGAGIYRWLKGWLVRERPFIRHAGIERAMAPLDRYSFPSGHTLHAVSFTWQACAHYPDLAWVLVPLAALIALSRIVLGLHYPTDVLAGGVLGALLAAIGLAIS
ncbi:MAG: phosphatase PAP2 family protein [Steroidobacteraceae bacterium]